MNGISDSRITENNVLLFGWTEIRSHQIRQKYVTFISAYLLKCSSWSYSSWPGSYLSVCQVQWCPICRRVAYNHICGSCMLETSHIYLGSYIMLWVTVIHRQLMNQPTIMVVAFCQKKNGHPLTYIPWKGGSRFLWNMGNHPTKLHGRHSWNTLFLLCMLWKPQLYFVSCCQIQLVQNILWTFSLLSAMQFRTCNVTVSYAWKNMLTENIIQFDPVSIWNLDLHPNRQTYFLWSSGNW